MVIMYTTKTINMHFKQGNICQTLCDISDI